jgi:tetratricopeptide (TPR) repeat protein
MNGNRPTPPSYRSCPDPLPSRDSLCCHREKMGFFHRGRSGLAISFLSILILSGPACSRLSSEKVWIERWSETTPLHLNRAGLGAVAVENRIYAIAGGEYLKDGLRIFDTVEYAEVLDNGQLGSWQYTSSLTTPRIYISTAVHNDTIYVMGGEGDITFYSGAPDHNAPTLLNSVERAKILPDGSLGEWILEKEKMRYARRGGELFVYEGWLYAVGGYNGAFLKNIERAKIFPDGSLGKWVEEKNLTGSVRYIAGYAQHQNRLYLLGGHLHSAEMAVQTAEAAEVISDSTVSPWTDLSAMTTRRFLNSAVRMDRTIYVLGGQNTVALSATERAEILPDGSLSGWMVDTPLNIPRRAAGAVGVGDTLYVIGGMNGPIGRASPVNAVEFAYRRPGVGLGHWVKPDSPDYTSYLAWKNSAPTDAVSHLEQSQNALAYDRYEAALFDASEALRLDPNSFEAYNIRADVSFRLGKPEDAIEALRQSLAIHENNFNALIGMGNIFATQERFREAVPYFQEAVRVNPESVPAHEQLGKAFLRTGDYVAAAAEFRWVLEKNPDSPPAQELLEFSIQQAASKR